MKTIDEIFGEMLSCLEEQTGLEPEPGCDLSVRMYAVAAQVYALYIQAQWVTRQAFPLLRYRTRDIGVIRHEKCSCGRTFVKMSKPMGRSDDMLIIRGVNVFPSQIETVLLNHGYPANYQIIVDRVKSTDTLDIQVEMTPEMFTDNLGEIDRRQKELVEGLRSLLGLAAKVTLVAPKSIVRSEGKAVRVIDKRKI